MYEQTSRNSSINFGTFVGRWLDQVHDDHQISGEFFRVAYSIRRHLSRSTLTCFPGNERLRTQADVSERTVQRALAKLEEQGHLKVHASIKKKPRVLAPILKEGDISTPEKMSTMSAMDDKMGDTRGDNGFEVHQRNQSGCAFNLQDSCNLLEGNALARARAGITEDEKLGLDVIFEINQDEAERRTEDERLSLDMIFEINQDETERRRREHCWRPIVEETPKAA
jgi:hypothetical protein